MVQSKISVLQLLGQGGHKKLQAGQVLADPNPNARKAERQKMQRRMHRIAKKMWAKIDDLPITDPMRTIVYKCADKDDEFIDQELKTMRKIMVL